MRMQPFPGSPRERQSVLCGDLLALGIGRGWRNISQAPTSESIPAAPGCGETGGIFRRFRPHVVHWCACSCAIIASSLHFPRCVFVCVSLSLSLPPRPPAAGPTTNSPLPPRLTLAKGLPHASTQTCLHSTEHKRSHCTLYIHSQIGL